MGDRANVHIKDAYGETNGVYLYTHYEGYELPLIVRDALERGRGRWDDDPYLARIIFCEMVKGDEMELTGFGISAAEMDKNFETIHIDCKEGTVSFGDQSWKIEEYVKLNKDQILKDWR